MFVPVDRIRTASAGPLRPMLLRLANAYLARSPKSFSSATAAGFTISGNTADVLQRHVHVFGVWEPPLTRWVQSQLRPGDLFLDFGANIGYFTLLAARAVGPSGRVIAFECMPSILEQLRRNIVENGVENVTVEPVIAGDEAGRSEVFLGPSVNVGISGTSWMPGGRSEGYVRRVVAADAVPRDLWERIRLIKIDVEGEEMNVLRGLAPLIDSLSAGASLVVEVSPERLEARGTTAQELFGFLTDRGFVAASLENEYNAQFYTRRQEVSPIALAAAPETQTDCIFVKGTEAPWMQRVSSG
jgi:FkbM family methyltransferase